MYKDRTIIALVGRVNVGKSTLYNAILRKKAAITHDRPGVTRDCKYEIWKDKDSKIRLLVDTPGYDTQENADSLKDQDLIQQITSITQVCDIIVYVVDGSVGIDYADQDLIKKCYESEKPIIVVANKIDIDTQECKNDIYRLQAIAHMEIAAKHKHGINQLIDKIVSIEKEFESDKCFDEIEKYPSFVLMGKPNVGKSTLTNQLVKQQAALVSEQAGTTRDSSKHILEWNGKKMTIIDTAGLRRKTKIKDIVERESVIQVIKALKSNVDVIVYMIDAQEYITDQDMRIMNMIQAYRKKMIIAFNKSDKLKEETKKAWREECNYQLKSMEHIKKIAISAEHGMGIKRLMEEIDVCINDKKDHSTSFLTQILHRALDTHQPPMVNNRRIKPKMAHQSKNDCYTIVIKGNQITKTPKSYLQYLAKFFQKSLKVSGINIIIKIDESDNPYA